MSNTFDTPTGKSVIIKESISRKEDRALNDILLKGVKANSAGAMDASSVAGNIQPQQDLVVLTFVESFDGNALTQAIIDGMDKRDFDFIHEKANNVYEGFKEKKS